MVASDVVASDGFLLASGLLYMALGGWVLTVRPRRQVNLWLGAFALAYGAGFAIINAVTLAGGDLNLGTLVQLPFLLIAVASMLGLAVVAPSPLTRDHWRLAAVPAASGVATLLAVLALSRPLPGLAEWTVALQAPLSGAVVAATFLLVARLSPRAGASPQGRRQTALLATALASLDALVAGFALTLAGRALAAGDAGAFGAQVVAVVPPVVVALALVAHGARTREPLPTALSGGLVLLVLMLAGAGTQALSATDESGFHWLRGVARTFGVLLLVYAILREQLLGLDAKVRFGISRGTIAAVFIAVFFAASEVAQLYFGSTFQSEYVGILGAGALVFAMAPLSRAADRLAERAIPVGGSEGAPAPRPAMAEAERDYGTALAAAMRDGRITPEEELALARLADRAGLGAEAVTRIRLEVLARHAATPKPWRRSRRGRGT